MKKIYLMLFSIFIIGFTTYFLLDSFVLSSNETVIEPEKKEKVSIEEKIVTDDYYKDDNIEITLTRDYQMSTHIYIADVKLANPEANLKTALAKNTYGKNVKDTTSNIAASVNAIFAVNGDFYGAREKGYVVRNYKTYRSKVNGEAEALAIYGDGSFEIVKEKKTKLSSLNNPKEVLSFGPALLINGQTQVVKGQEVAKARATNPRTAVGIIEKGHYIFIVSDGRTKKSKGLSLYQLANYMKKFNVDIAYNLDGGGSSSMIFNGKLINQPTHTGKKIVERKVSDIVYIGY